MMITRRTSDEKEYTQCDFEAMSTYEAEIKAGCDRLEKALENRYHIPIDIIYMVDVNNGAVVGMVMVSFKDLSRYKYEIPNNRDFLRFTSRITFFCNGDDLYFDFISLNRALSETLTKYIYIMTMSEEITDYTPCDTCHGNPEECFVVEEEPSYID